MKICSPHCGVSYESNSGGEVYERELLKRIVSMGHDLYLILKDNKVYDKNIQWNVYKAKTYRNLPFDKYFSTLRYLPIIRDIYRKNNFDILRAHSVRYIGPLCIWSRLAYKIKVPIVAHHHHLDKDILTSVLDKSVLHFVDRIITVSFFSKRQLQDELCISGEKIEVVYCGVDEKYFSKEENINIKETFGWKDKIVLMTLSSLTPRKNLSFLLDIFHWLYKSRKSLVLVIAGEGPLKPYLIEKSSKLGIQNSVYFTGYIPESEKVKYINCADIFLFTSGLEGFGLSVAEAMACGKPVVVTNTSSLPEVIGNEECGFLCKNNDMNDFIQKIEILLDNPLLRTQMGEMARKRIYNSFRWEKTAQNVCSIYEKLIRDYDSKKKHGYFL